MQGEIVCPLTSTPPSREWHSNDRNEKYIAWIVQIFHLLHSTKYPKLYYNWCSKNQKCRLHLLIKLGMQTTTKPLHAADYYDLD